MVDTIPLSDALAFEGVTARIADLEENSLDKSTETSDVITEGTTNLFLTSSERTKLGTVETDADKTDAENVAAAGATMATDLASTDESKGASLVGLRDAANNFTATTVEGALAELFEAQDGLSKITDLKGTWDASGGTFPAGDTAGWYYIVDTPGTVDGVSFAEFDRIVALTDGASASTYAGNWLKMSNVSGTVVEVNGKSGAVSLDADDIPGISAAGKSGSYNDLTDKPTIGLPLPSGGSTGQVLVKVSSTNGDAAWSNPPAAGVTSVGISAPSGMEAGAAVTGAGNINLSWQSGYGPITGAQSTKLAGIAEGATANSPASDANIRAGTGSGYLTADSVTSANAAVALTPGSTVSFDWTDGTFRTLVMSGDYSLGSPTNGIPGTSRLVYVVGNNATPRTLSFGAKIGTQDEFEIDDITAQKAYLLTIVCVTEDQYVLSSVAPAVLAPGEGILLAAGTAATGTSTAPNSPEIVVPWGEQPALFITAFGTGQSLHPISGTPSGFGSQVGTSTSTANRAYTVAMSQQATAETLDPAAWTVPSGAWWAATIAIPGTPTIVSSFASIETSAQSTVRCAGVGNVDFYGAVEEGDLIVVITTAMAAGAVNFQEVEGWNLALSGTTGTSTRAYAVYWKIAEGPFVNSSFIPNALDAASMNGTVFYRIKGWTPQ